LPQPDDIGDELLPNWLQTEWVLPIGIIVILTIIVIPVPTFIMNLLIVINIAAGVVILLTVVYMEKAVQFSSFPSLLLSYTIFGLAINVTTTRNILMGGPQRVQGVITAFGNFVIGGDVIVGVIVFTIIMIIQYLVVVKGTTRVSEVAARFTLDSMPGKQMAIDADLNAGLIDQEEAKQRRQELRAEADFYGAMDGASKFIQGNVTAGIILIIINSIGGWAIGFFRMGMDPIEAIQTYVILTAGDGLAAQIPALMVNAATGLIVTQASDRGDLGENLARQLTRFPKALYITGATLITLGVVTPLPTFVMSVIGLGIVGLGRSLQSMRERAMEEPDIPEEEMEDEEGEREPEDVSQILRVDPMELECGYALIPLVDPDQGGDLLERITVIRRRMALDMGLIVPPIRIRDNMQLEPNKYILKIRNTEVATGDVYPDQFLAMNPGDVTEELEGQTTTEPAFGLPATWINEDQREKAEQAGYTVVDPSSVIATHITEVIKDNAADILGRDQVQTMIERLEDDYPALVDDVYPDPINAGLLQRVLEILLEERVSIRNLVTIVETMADRIQQGVTEAETLAEYCRMSLGREITGEYTSEDDVLNVLSLDPELEQYLQSEMSEHDQGLPLGPEEGQALMQQIQSEVEAQRESGIEPVIMVPPAIRRPFYTLVRRQVEDLPVLSYNEIPDDVAVEVVGVIRLQQEQEV
jgi:flagellar biosynthesis protein FlhA